MTGCVKHWDAQKGFGFIVDDGDGREHFVHHTALLLEPDPRGHRNLRKGDRVEFRGEVTPRGLRAFDVREVTGAPTGLPVVQAELLAD